MKKLLLLLLCIPLLVLSQEDVTHNLIGEELISEDLQQFVGEYVKSINLNNNSKGIYFLEIETGDGVINKKLILQ